MLSINLSELVWTIINFFLLLFLLKRFLFDPVSRFMDEREARIHEGREAERRAQEKLEENARQQSERKAEFREQAAAILNEAAQDDARRTADAYTAAREKAAELQQTGEAELRDRHTREAEALKAREPELAALLASHLLGEEE